MIINNRYFDIELEDILEDMGITEYKSGSDNIQIYCPYHSDGKELHMSAGIHKDTLILHCFACSTVKSLVEFISDYLHLDGWDWLKNKYLSNNIQNRKDIELNFTDEEVTYLDKSELKKYRYYHNYLASRKIPLEIARRYDLGYDKEKDCITFPIYDYEGNLLYFATRSIIGKHFHYPEGVKKPIYGIYQLNRDYPNCKEVIICESMINALTCISYGKPAIALNGTGTQEQYNDLIKFPYRHYILALDPDKAGEIGTNKLISVLRFNKLLSKYIIPKGKDINDLSEEEFNNLECIEI